MSGLNIKKAIQSAAGRLLLVGFNNGFITLLSIGTALILARILTIEEYGRVIFFMGWVSTLRVLFSLGLGTKISKDVAESLENRYALQERFNSLLFLRMGTVIAGGILTLLVLYSGLKIDYILLAWSATSLAVLADFFVAVLGSLQHIRGVNSVLLTQPLSFLILVIGLTLLKPGDLLLKTIWGYILSFGLSLLMGVYLVSRTKRFNLAVGSTSITYLRQSLQFIGAVYLLALLRSYYRVLVTLVLGWQAQFDLVSLVGIPLNLILLPASLISVGIVNIIYPELCRHSAAERRAQFIASLDTYFRFLSLGGLIYLMVLAAFPAEIITLVYSAKYASSYLMVYFLAPTALFDLWGTLFMFALIARGKTVPALTAAVLQTLILLAGVFLAVSLPMTLTQYQVWLGLAYTLSSGLGVLWMWGILKRDLALSLTPSNILRNAWILLVVFLVFLTLKSLVGLPALGFLPVSLIGALVALIISYKSGILREVSPWILSK